VNEEKATLQKQRKGEIEQIKNDREEKIKQ